MIDIFFNNNQSCLSQKRVWSSGKCRKLGTFYAPLSNTSRLGCKNEVDADEDGDDNVQNENSGFKKYLKRDV